MQKLRNLPHIASMAFNSPLLIEPAYARVFFCALASQMGIGGVRDTGGELLTGEQITGELAMYGDERPTARKTYQVSDRIAVIPVNGTLVSKGSYLSSLSGMTGYNTIITTMRQAISDPDVDGILLDMDTPGGMVAGAFDCADNIARLREIKPIWALANDMNCSAGQLIASAASRRLVTQTARTGSIGVLMAHYNYAGQLEQKGVEVTLLHSGAHKVDGNPTEKLPDDVRDRIQAQIDATRLMFAESVAKHGSMSIEQVLATEAAVYSGAEALDVGLADELVLNTDAVAVMRDAIGSKPITRNNGGSMSNSTTSPLVTNLQGDEVLTTSQPEAGAVITGEQLQSAVLAENQRIMGILNCEEATGRELQAQALAATPGMSVEDAQRIMASSAQSAQSRSDTALDALMENAPDAVQGGMGGENANADNDLLDIPV
ncbi:S49 family peptidase [Buttiauxella sp. A111]|uniref:S49 family peptidase n=1 Tax=Buttiauxella sp. A111 TaxID=2563088 RepID=UPI0010F0AB0F|nr:S49 family peptidase [Buttiauxella sp. A111]GDX06647.1 S49 family peptidase [Buttiauxella sp. A111]